MREQPWATPILLVSLGVAFAEFSVACSPWCSARRTSSACRTRPRLPVFAHLAIVLLLGVYVPPYLADWYRAAGS